MSAPELPHMRVLRDPDGPLDQTDEAARPITFRDLLMHRSGLTYGEFHRGPIARAHAEILGPQIDNPRTPDEWMARLATLPLIDQPGAGFHYGLSNDVLGFLIARLDGAPLGAVLKRRVLDPLGMRDTGFTVAPPQRDRCAGLCGFDGEGRLTPLTEARGRHATEQRPDRPTFEAGGGGLWSIPMLSTACSRSSSRRWSRTGKCSWPRTATRRPPASSATRTCRHATDCRRTCRWRCTV